MKTDPCIVFTHIPKTAGETMGAILEKQCFPTHIFSFNMPSVKAHQRFMALNAKQKKRLKIIKGHWPYGIHRDLNRPCRYFTFLRDPVARTVSEYNYITSHPASQDYDFITKNKLSLVDFSMLSKETQNIQAKFVSGLGRKAVDINLDDLLAFAEKALNEDFKFVGIVEQFDRSLILLKEIFDLKDIDYSKKNVGKKRSTPLSQREEETIRSNNSIDSFLYNEARKKIDRAWEDNADYLNRQLTILQKQNSRYQQYRRMKRFAWSVLCRAVWKANGYR